MDAPYVATATTECELWFLSYKVSAAGLVILWQSCLPST